MSRNAFVAFVLLMFLSGCTAEEEQLIDEGGVEAPVATSFPSWSAMAHDSSEMNGTMFENTSHTSLLHGVLIVRQPWMPMTKLFLKGK